MHDQARNSDGYIVGKEQVSRFTHGESARPLLVQEQEDLSNPDLCSISHPGCSHHQGYHLEKVKTHESIREEYASRHRGDVKINNELTLFSQLLS